MQCAIQKALFRVWIFALAAIGSLPFTNTTANAQDFLEDTYLIDIRAGEGLSQVIRQFAYGG